MLRMANAEDKAPADQAFHEALPPGQMREEDLTPAKLRELKDGIASFLTMAYAERVKTPADMTAAELREQLEMRDKLVGCLRAEVKVLSTWMQQNAPWMQQTAEQAALRPETDLDDLAAGLFECVRTWSDVLAPRARQLNGEVTNSDSDLQGGFTPADTDDVFLSDDDVLSDDAQKLAIEELRKNMLEMKQAFSQEGGEDGKSTTLESV